jgi:arsenate reductase
LISQAADVSALRNGNFNVGFDAPPALAKGAATEEDARNIYRRVRDEIRQFVERLPESLSAK